MQLLFERIRQRRVDGSQLIVRLRALAPANGRFAQDLGQRLNGSDGQAHEQRLNHIPIGITVDVRWEGFQREFADGVCVATRVLSPTPRIPVDFCVFVDLRFRCSRLRAAAPGRPAPPSPFAERARGRRSVSMGREIVACRIGGGRGHRLVRTRASGRGHRRRGGTCRRCLPLRLDAPLARFRRGLPPC